MLDLTTGNPEFFHIDDFHTLFNDLPQPPTWRESVDSPCQNSAFKARKLAFEPVIDLIDDADGLELVGTDIGNSLVDIVWMEALALESSKGHLTGVQRYSWGKDSLAPGARW